MHPDGNLYSESSSPRSPCKPQGLSGGLVLYYFIASTGVSTSGYQLRLGLHIQHVVLHIHTVVCQGRLMILDAIALNAFSRTWLASRNHQAVECSGQVSTHGAGSTSGHSTTAHRHQPETACLSAFCHRLHCNGQETATAAHTSLGSSASSTHSNRHSNQRVTHCDGQCVGVEYADHAGVAVVLCLAHCSLGQH